MEFDWTTFLLEMVNFLILVWLLKRFFYRPVRAAIESRRVAIHKTLDEARQVHAEADALKQQYEGRLRSWAEARRKAMEQLAAEVEAERGKRLAALQQELAREREKAGVLAAREREKLERQVTDAALARAGRFLDRLLGAVAGPELEQRLLDLFVQQLSGMAAGDRQALQDAWRDPAARPMLTTAFAVSGERREAVESALHDLLGEAPSGVDWRRDESLLAGVRLEAGGWAACADLRDELAFFREAAREQA